MKTVDTSLEAYNEIKSSGYLGALQELAYELIFQNAPIAQFELDLLHIDLTGRKTPDRSLAKRVSELEREGLVRKCGKKINPHSGNKHECHLYETTLTVLTAPWKAAPSTKERAKEFRASIERTSKKHGDKKVSCEQICDIFLARMDKYDL